MLVKVISSFVTSSGAKNPDDQFELDDKLVAEYVADGLIVPVPVAKPKETATAKPVEATAVAPAAK